MTEDFIAQERKNTADIYLPNTETWVAEVDGKVEGFIALMNNEVGAIFVQPCLQGSGIGKALMDKARTRHGELEVEVFKANTIGRNFYAKYGFKHIQESLHEPTGQEIIRLKYKVFNKSSD